MANPLAGIALAGCLTALAACGDEAQPDFSVTVSDSAGIRIVQNVLSEPIPTCPVSGPEVTIGRLDGPEEYQLYRVFGARRLRDGRIVLMNRGSNELRFYDSTGVFLSRVGREGDGPGEFRRGDGIWVTTGDTLWVGDLHPPWGYHLFDLSGEWQRTVQPEPPQLFDPFLVVVLEDGSSVTAEFVIRARTPTLSLQEVTATLHSPNGELVDTVGVYPMGRYARLGEGLASIAVRPFFEATTSLDGAGRRIYAGDGSEAEVTVFELVDGRVRLASKVRWTPGDRTIREADVRAVKETMIQGSDGLPPAVLETMLNRPVADRFPAFSRIVANRSGGFWVQRYPRPTNGEANHWLSFDTDGQFICEISLPPVRIVDLGSDYLLAVRTTELDVEQIVMYRFETR